MLHHAMVLPPLVLYAIQFQIDYLTQRAGVRQLQRRPLPRAPEAHAARYFASAMPTLSSASLTSTRIGPGAGGAVDR
jgi:hypothetical protein